MHIARLLTSGFQRFLLVFTLAVSAGTVAPADIEARDYGKVELIRDTWGVPHVFAETDAGAMYGLGYANAEDRGFQMHYTLRIIQGRLAEVIGDVKKIRRNETAVQSDRKMRTFGFDRAADERVKQLDDESVALLAAFSDGVNDYFDQHRDDLPELFGKVGLEPEPWTPADCILSWWHLAQFFATDGTRDLMHYRNLAQGGGRRRPIPPFRGGDRGGPQRPLAPADLTPIPQDESTAVVGREDVTDQWLRQTHAFLSEHGHKSPKPGPAKGNESGPKFSHAWVVGGKMSGTGAAVLVSMPQTPVTNPSLMYEFHIHGNTFDARGIGVPGSPVILIGWNKHVAWGMTAMGADQADLFRLKTDDEHPDQYEFDGQWRPIEQIREEINVKGGRTNSLVVRQTHFGPIVNEFAFSRPGDPPVALKRVPICDTDRDTIQGSLAMMRACAVKDFLAALDGWRFPTANVVFGDTEGNIGYSTIGALPLRSSQALEVGGAAHDGSAARFDWQTVIPQKLVPHVINPQEGYLFSGNHRPVGSFYPIALGIRTGSMGDSLRSWRLRQLLEGKTSMNPQEVHDMFTDSTNPARQAIAQIGYHLRDVLKRDLSESAQLALKHLDDWYAKGAPSRLDVPGAELAIHINTLFRLVSTNLTAVYGGGESGLSHFLKTVGKRLDADPAADITPLEQDFVDRALAGAWTTAERNYGPDPANWPEVARRQVTERKLGAYESLDGFPSLEKSLDMSYPGIACTDGATVFSQGGQAYVQWVPMDNVDGARSLLPPGPSERPGSPMRVVNVDGWVRGQLNPAPLSRKAVEELAQSSTVLLSKAR
ncbi:MAG: penicillin acylase family protein [Planctomycetes bacterium]|nr:penicillin acylase family protein [Planctomycetota bacterium]MBL7043079.1 penicillin acylase family protein [Pirellulaceae bacterium]